MKNRWKNILAAALTALTVTPGLAGTMLQAQEAELESPDAAPAISMETMPVAEVQKGMRGIVKTTFDGTEVVEVEAEVLGKLPGAVGSKFELIIIRLEGQRIEHQGVAGGMSGSPFYIDGKLVGAVSYRLGTFPKEPFAGVTPIRYMLDTQYGGTGAPQLSVDYHSMFAGKPSIERMAERLGAELQPRPMHDTKTASTTGLQPLGRRVSASGLHPVVQQMFAPWFAQIGLELTAGSTMARGGGPVAGDLAPGKPISIMLMDGDFSFGASGTVTHVDRNRVWAFGHPFTQYGSVDFIMAEAEMIVVLSDLQGSSNLSRSGEVVGAITEDRLPAIYGEIGKTADTFPMSVQVSYNGTEVETYTYRIVRGKLLSPGLVALALIQSLYATQGVIGSQSALLTGEIEVEGFDTIELEEFYSGESIINEMSFLPASVFFFLGDNEFTPVRFKDVRLKVDIEEELSTAEVSRAWLTKTEVRAGERFDLMIEIKPRRGKARLLEPQPFFIPPTLQPGTYNITIGNGAAISAQENEMVQGQIQPRGVPHMIRLINTLRPNNRVYAQTWRQETGVYYEGDFFPSLPPSALSVIRTNGMDDDFVGLSGSVIDERRIETDYLIEGVRRLTFTIKR